MKKYLKLIPFLIGLFIGIITYWFQPYNQTELGGISIWLIIGALSFIGALIFSFLNEPKAFRLAFFISLGVLLANLIRICYDIQFWDPTSHNLAPFELIFAFVCSFPSALVGAYIGAFIPISFKS